MTVRTWALRYSHHKNSVLNMVSHTDTAALAMPYSRKWLRWRRGRRSRVRFFVSHSCNTCESVIRRSLLLTPAMKDSLRDSTAAVLHSRLLTIMVTGQIMKINFIAFGSSRRYFHCSEKFRWKSCAHGCSCQVGPQASLILHDWAEVRKVLPTSS